jgi:cytoskeleton protein RodZ
MPAIRPGGSLQRTTVSVGPALRKVREARGVTLEEAARDTRVRLEFLEAIEAEDFHLLLGDVHLRGCLRTYATYLRLSPDKVVAMYDAELGRDDEVVVVPPPARSEPVLGARRRRDDHRLWILVAATVLVLAGAFGVLSARRPAPPPANLSGATGSVVAGAELERPISVAVEAKRAVEVTIVADGGEPDSYQLRAGEGRSFDGDNSITIRLAEGNTAHVIVSGVDYGFPGKNGEPWEDTYSYDEPSTPGG